MQELLNQERNMYKQVFDKMGLEAEYMTKQKHILRYGTNADKKFIQDKSYYYDLLAINGNMLAYTPGALAGFIRENLLNNPGKGFFIDPITHSFQHSLDKIKSYSKKEEKETIKLSIANLIQQYGEPLISKIKEPEDREDDKGRPIRPEDFEGHEKTFCENVINFQLNEIKNKNKEKGFLKYLIDMDDQLDDFEPDFVTPPYFYLSESSYEEWLELNIDFIKIAREKYPDNNIYAQLTVSQDIFISESMRKKIINDYKDLNIEGILLWIDDFNEHEASKTMLEIYINMIKVLSDGLNIYNLYGSFFSTILTGFKEELSFSLAGVGHGMEYGEYRAVVPVGGGIPASKYYFYPLHKRLKFDTAQEYIKSHVIDKSSDDKIDQANRYFDEICDCPKCKEIIDDNIDNFFAFQSTKTYEYEVKGVKRQRTYPDQETKENCLIHYLESKVKEFKEVEKIEVNDFLNNLEKKFELYKDYKHQDLETLSYLKRWKSVLESELNADG